VGRRSDPLNRRLRGRLHGRHVHRDLQRLRRHRSDGVLRGSARVASVQVKDPNLEAHLQSPEFFDAERHPKLTFESKSIERDGDRVRIDGEITIKGHTEPVELSGVITDRSSTRTAASASA